MEGAGGYPETPTVDARVQSLHGDLQAELQQSFRRSGRPLSELENGATDALTRWGRFVGGGEDTVVKSPGDAYESNLFHPGVELASPGNSPVNEPAFYDGSDDGFDSEGDWFESTAMDHVTVVKKSILENAQHGVGWRNSGVSSSWRNSGSSYQAGLRESNASSVRWEDGDVWSKGGSRRQKKTQWGKMRGGSSTSVRPTIDDDVTEGAIYGGSDDGTVAHMFDDDDDYLITGGLDTSLGPEGDDGVVRRRPKPGRGASTQQKTMSLLSDNVRWSKAWAEEKARMQIGKKVTIQVTRKTNTEPFGMKLARESTGAVVRGMVENSASERAGVLIGDIVVAVNGMEFARSEEGHDQALTVFRGALGSIKLVVERTDAQKAKLDMRFSAKATSPDVDEEGNYRVPIKIIRDRSKKGLGVTLAREDWGASVRSVKPGSPAAAAGLLPGDAIVVVNGIELPDSPNSYDHIIFAIQAATDDVGLVVERTNEGAKKKPVDTGYFEPSDMENRSQMDATPAATGLGVARAVDGVMGADGVISPPLSFVLKQKWYGRASIPKPFTINWEDGRPAFDVFYANGGEAFELRMAGQDGIVGTINVSDDGCGCFGSSRSFWYTYANEDDYGNSEMRHGSLVVSSSPFASSMKITTQSEGGYHIISADSSRQGRNKKSNLLSQEYMFEASDGSRVLTCNRPTAGLGIGDTYRIVVSALMNPQLAILVMLSFDKIRSDDKPSEAGV